MQQLLSKVLLFSLLYQIRSISINSGTSLDDAIQTLAETGGELILQDEGPYEIRNSHDIKGAKFWLLGNGTKLTNITIYAGGKLVIQSPSALSMKRIFFRFEDSSGQVLGSAFLNTKATQNLQIERCNFTGKLRGRSFLLAEDFTNITIWEAVFDNLLFTSEKWDCPLVSLCGGFINLTSLYIVNSTIENGSMVLLQNKKDATFKSELAITNVTLNSVIHTFQKADERSSGFIISTLEGLAVKIDNCYFLQNSFDAGLAFLRNSGLSVSLSNCLFKENKCNYLFYISNVTSLVVSGVNHKLISPSPKAVDALILKLSGCFLLLDGFQSISMESSIFQDGEPTGNSLLNFVNTLTPKIDFINLNIKTVRLSNMKSSFKTNASLMGTFLHIRSVHPINLTIADSYFSYGRLNNFVPASSVGGPALYLLSDKAITNISSCTFFFNVANLGASCIQFQGKVLNLEKSYFYRNGEINFATQKSYGPVAASAFILKVNFTDFIETRDEIQCGVTLMRSQSYMALQYMIVNNSNFLNSFCDRNYDGGMLYFDSKIFLLSFFLENTKLKGCDTFIGTMFLKTKYRVEISFYNVTFFNLTCFRGGCAVSFDFKEGMILWTLVNFTLMKGDGPTSGGGATICYFDELNTKSSGIMIYNSIYKDLTTNTYGGAYYIIGGWYFVKNTSFINCMAPWGGVLATTYNIAEFENCLFYRNVGSELASTILLRDRVDLRIDGCQFTENFSPKGATISVESSFLILRNSVFSSNKGVHPALIEFSLTSEISLIENISVSFTKSTTYLFTLFSAQLEIRSSSFLNNSVGILKAADSEITIRSSKVRNSFCFEKGCISYLEKSNLSLFDSDMYDIKSTNLINAYFLVQSGLKLTKIILIDIINTIDHSIGICDGEGSFIQILQSVFSGLHNHGLILRYSAINFTACTFYNPPNDKSILVLFSTTDSNVTFLDNLVYDFDGRDSDHSTFSMLFNEWNQALITGNHFENILNSEFGLLFFKNGNVTVLDNRFQGNRAEKGSCLFFTCEFKNLSICNTLVKSNFFFNNHGKMGSFLFWTIKKPIIQQNKVEGNEAEFGLGASSDDFKLAFEIIDILTNEVLYNSFKDIFITNKYVIKNVRNGMKIPIRIEIFFIDFEGQKLLTHDDIVLINDLRPSPLSENITLEADIREIQGRKIPRISNNTFIFDEIVIVGNLTHTYDLVFSVSPEFKIDKNLLSYTVPSYHDFVTAEGYLRLVIPLQISPCSMGESFDDLKKRCESCISGLYSFKTNESCTVCQDGLTCKGGSVVETNERFWRSSKTSELVYKCMGDGSQCIGGLDSNCDRGYKGPLCSLCNEAEARGYFRFGVDPKCFDCGKIFWILIIFLPLLLMVHLIFYRLFSFLARLSPETIFVFRSIIMYFSSSFLLSEIVWRDSPGFYYYYGLFWNILSNFYTMGVIDCFLRLDPLLKSFFFQLLPYLSILILLLVVYIKKRRDLEKLKITARHQVSYFINVYLFVIPSLIHISVRSLSCTFIDEKFYSSLNLSQSCFQGSHFFFFIFSILTFGIFGIGIPFYCYRTLRMQHGNKLLPNSSLHMLVLKVIHRYLSSPYETKYYYWEFVNYGFNLIILSYFGFYSFEPGAAATFALVINFIQYIIENTLDVFKTEFFNRVQKARQMFTILVMLSLQIGVIMQDRAIAIVAGVSIIVNHLGFYIYLMFVLREEHNLIGENAVMRRRRIASELKSFIGKHMSRNKIKV